MAEILAVVLILAGVVLALIAAIGLQRFGDVFSRMHAATKPATLGLVLCLVGAGIAIPIPGALVKLVLVIVFQFLTAPIGAQLIGRASFHAGAEMHPSTNYDELSSRIFPDRGPGEE